MNCLTKTRSVLPVSVYTKICQCSIVQVHHSVMTCNRNSLCKENLNSKLHPTHLISIREYRTTCSLATQNIQNEDEVQISSVFKRPPILAIIRYYYYLWVYKIDFGITTRVDEDESFVKGILSVYKMIIKEMVSRNKNYTFLKDILSPELLTQVDEGKGHYERPIAPAKLLLIMQWVDFNLNKDKNQEIVTRFVSSHENKKHRRTYIYDMTFSRSPESNWIVTDIIDVGKMPLLYQLFPFTKPLVYYYR